MGIRYDLNFNKEIKRVVSNFNRKIARLEKQGKELLPDRIYVKDLKENYDKRRELKRKLREMQRFSQRGVEEVIRTEGGVKITKYALDNLKRDIRRSKYILGREERRLSARVTPLTITRKSALNLVTDKLKLLSKDITKLKKRDIETITANVKRTLNYDHKLEQFQENFFQILFSEAFYSGVSQDTLENIKNIFSQLTPDELLRLSKEDPHIKAMLDYSPTEGNIISARRMRNSLHSIEKGLPLIIKDVLDKEIVI